MHGTAEGYVTRLMHVQKMMGDNSPTLKLELFKMRIRS